MHFRLKFLMLEHKNNSNHNTIKHFSTNISNMNLKLFIGRLKTNKMLCFEHKNRQIDHRSVGHLSQFESIK